MCWPGCWTRRSAERAERSALAATVPPARAWNSARIEARQRQLGRVRLAMPTSLRRSWPDPGLRRFTSHHHGSSVLIAVPGCRVGVRSPPGPDPCHRGHVRWDQARVQIVPSESARAGDSNVVAPGGASSTASVSSVRTRSPGPGPGAFSGGRANGGRRAPRWYRTARAERASGGGQGGPRGGSSLRARGVGAGAGPADPVELLEEQATTRVPELVPIRYGRMLVSPFTFYRGAAYLMAADLAGLPQDGPARPALRRRASVELRRFAAPDRRLVFSINDFDETLPGPFEWDVKRLVASFAVAGRDRGFDDKQRRSINPAVARAYREAMSELRRDAQPRPLVRARRRRRARRARRRTSDARSRCKRSEKNLAKTRAKDSLRAFGKLTEIVDGEPRIVERPAGRVPIEDICRRRSATSVEDFLRGVIRSYRRTLPATAAGCSSATATCTPRARSSASAASAPAPGSCCLLGRDDNDPLFLQFKEARGLGARAVPRQERVREPRPARRRGPAPDAGRQRHHARLDPHRRHRRRRARLLRPPALGREGLRARRADGAGDDARLRDALRRGRSRARTPAPATRSRSRATSATATPSTAPSPPSPSRTPTRTNATTPR